MSHYNALKHQDFRAVYWLLGECCELGYAPEAWTLRLFEFFRTHLGVHMTVCFEGSADMTHGRTSPGPKDEVLIYGKPAQHVLGLMHDYWKSGGINDDPAMPAWRKIRRPIITRARQQLATDRTWQQSTIVNEYFRRTDSGEMILSTCPVASNTHLLFNLWRPLHDKCFSERDTQVVDLIIREISTLFTQKRLAPLSASLKNLPPRLRQILDLLYRGNTEKHIAEILGSSVHTVHNQVQTLYRTLNISNRSQLFSLLSRTGHQINRANVR